MLRDVARELVGVELSWSVDEVEDRLLRLDAEHDRGVAELQVEIEQQRAAVSGLRQCGGEVRRDHRLARAALRREDRDDPAFLPCARCRTRCVRRLADREDDVLGQRGQQEHVRHIRAEGVFEQGGCLAGRDQQERDTRVLADRRDLVRRQRRRARRKQDTVEMAAFERGRRTARLLGVADDLDSRLLRERLAKLLEALAGAGQIDAGCLTHRWPTPSVSIVVSVSCQRGLFAALADGRISNRQSLPWATIHSIFCDCASVSRSCAE